MEYVQMTLDEWARMKQSIEDDLRSLSEGFVRVGYKLRQIRDQELYKHDGYETIAEWARAEYGLNASTVSRFIAINQKYSVDGNSDRLRPEFGKLGQSKLAEMLTLPDSDLQMVEPAMSREGIRELKQFNKAAPDRGVADDLYELIEQFWKDNLDLKAELIKADGLDVDEAKEMVNPSGNRTYRKGLFFMAMYEGNIQFKKFRCDPQTMEWGEFFRITRIIFDEQAEEEAARKAAQDIKKAQESAREPEESAQEPQENAQKPQETAQEPQESVREEPEETEHEELKGGELEEAETADDGGRPDPAVEDPEPAAVDPGESIGQVSEAGREGSGEEQEDEGQGAEADGEDDQDDGWMNLPETAEVIAPAQQNGLEASIHIILENLQKAVNVKAYKSALSSAENLIDQLRKLVEGGDQ